MGWGCYKHEWDIESDACQDVLKDLCRERLQKEPRDWGRDGAICPLCWTEQEQQKDALLETLKDALERIPNLTRDERAFTYRAGLLIAKVEGYE